MFWLFTLIDEMSWDWWFFVWFYFSSSFWVWLPSLLPEPCTRWPSSARTLRWPMTHPATNKSKSPSLTSLNFTPFSNDWPVVDTQLRGRERNQSGRERTGQADHSGSGRNHVQGKLLVHCSRWHRRHHQLGGRWERIPALWCSPARRSSDARSRGQALGWPPCRRCPVNVFIGTEWHYSIFKLMFFVALKWNKMK